ncbi:MAG: hypothetical protein HKN88_09680 [Gammaproteobacteria bacterium]|nr:SurA N-terminal domain-containing protein [Gammaproteobacteria bacterium]NNC98326.1 hypothetical protein [Gammaproteobacteria bacterium]NNM14415.1 hypothetical protein [Gammaproteobacteria bacterium]
MLQLIRSRVTGILAIVVLVLITLSFVFFGVTTPSLTGVNYAAKVNGVEIPLNEFRSGVQRAESRYSQYYPDGIPDETRQQLRDNILDTMIRDELIRQRIYDDRYRITNDALLDQIKSIPQFQINGQFDRKVYEQQLLIAGQSPGQFERSLKNSLSINQLRNALASSAFSIPAEITQKQILENEQRSAAFAIIPASRFKEQVSISDEDILAEYEASKASLLSEEAVDIEYIELTTQDLAKDVEVNDEILADYYASVSFRFGTPEEREARHILIATDEGDPQEKKAFAESLLEQIENGADFGELAKEHSDDLGSAASNGELGFFGRGKMVPEFENAAFSLDIGETSDLVKTQYGYHIIQVTDIKESDSPAFADLDEEQRTSLESEYRQLQVEGYLGERAEELANEVFDARDTLSDVAQNNGLTVKTQKNITRSSFAGLAALQEVKKAIFSEELRNGTNSDLIAASADQAIFLRVTEYRDVRQKSLDEVKAQLRAQLESKAASKMAADAGIALQAEISSVEELQAKAEENDYSFTPEASITRSQAGIQGELLGAIFNASKPQGEQAVEEGVEMNNGDYAIFYLTEVTPGAVDSMAETEKQAASRAISAQNGNNEMNAYLASLREKADIYIPPEQEELNN